MPRPEEPPRNPYSSNPHHVPPMPHAPQGGWTTLLSQGNGMKAFVVFVVISIASIVGGTLYAEDSMREHAEKAARIAVQQNLTEKIIPKINEVTRAAERAADAAGLANEAAKRSEKAVDAATELINRALLLQKRQSAQAEAARNERTSLQLK